MISKKDDLLTRRQFLALLPSLPFVALRSTFCSTTKFKFKLGDRVRNQITCDDGKVFFYEGTVVGLNTHHPDWSDQSSEVILMKVEATNDLCQIESGWFEANDLVLLPQP